MSPTSPDLWGATRMEGRKETTQQAEAERQQVAGNWWSEPEKRLKVWATILVTLTIVFFALSAQSPEGQQWMAKVRLVWQERERARQFQKALANDPPVGTSLERLGLDHSPLATRHSLPLLVVVFGGCEGCGAQRLREWAEVLSNWETWRKHLKGVLVIQDKEEKVQEAVKRNGWEVTVIADEGGKIGKKLNAFFTPRAYGFEGGRLVWVQKRASIGVVEVLESFLGQVKGNEKAKELVNAWSAEMREKVWGKEMAELTKGMVDLPYSPSTQRTQSLSRKLFARLMRNNLSIWHQTCMLVWLAGRCSL